MISLAGRDILHSWTKFVFTGIGLGLAGLLGGAGAIWFLWGLLSGFLASLVGWFAWVLQPQRQLRWPRGPFPRRADHVERIPETVLERVIGPLNDAVMAVSAWVRQRQQGHLPDYILYLVAGLAAIGALVVFENM